MGNCCRQRVVVPLVFFIALNLHLLMMPSDGRYLRPSDHGLAYQDTTSSHATTKSNATEMLSFFNAGRTVSLPEAKNLTGGGIGGATWWKNRERRMSRDAHRNHVREILLITSLVCGLTGVVLLVVWAFVFVIRYRREGQQGPRQRRAQLGRVEWSKHQYLSPHEATSALATAGDGGVQIK